MSEPGEFALQTIPPELLPLTLHIPVLPSDVVQVVPGFLFAQALSLPVLCIQSAFDVLPVPFVVYPGSHVVGLLTPAGQYEPAGQVVLPLPLISPLAWLYVPLGQ